MKGNILDNETSLSAEIGVPKVIALRDEHRIRALFIKMKDFYNMHKLYKFSLSMLLDLLVRVIRVSWGWTAYRRLDVVLRWHWRRPIVQFPFFIERLRITIFHRGRV